MPHLRSIGIVTSLYFPAEEVGWAKSDCWVGTNAVDKGGKVVVHDIIAVPPTEKHRLQHFNLVIAHLIVCNENGPRSRPLSFWIPGEHAKIAASP